MPRLLRLHQSLLGVGMSTQTAAPKAVRQAADKYLPLATDALCAFREILVTNATILENLFQLVAHTAEYAQGNDKREEGARDLLASLPGAPEHPILEDLYNCITTACTAILTGDLASDSLRWVEGFRDSAREALEEEGNE